MACPAVDLRKGRPVTGTDIAAIITAIGGAVAAVLGALALVKRRSSELGKQHQADCEDCYVERRVLIRWINRLRDLLAIHGIPEPEGLDDELGNRRQTVQAEE
jgi:LPXTG-motif cell wall-anchored protein